jgi:catechol 2,3-dioxygenase-like lactoylglutathione lyase family enzyme
MKLGAFSASLSVKDINVSKQFYETLGFHVYAGQIEKNYLIMKNGKFEKNILTFNPGWDENANKVEPFDDIRDIQKHLKKQGITLEKEVDENSSGPASLFLIDPDGNTILLDQHV